MSHWLIVLSDMMYMYIFLLPPFPQYVFMAWCLIKQWTRFHGVVLV